MTACSSKTREAFQLAMASINLTPEQSDTPVEADPTSRYLRYPLLLGKGACKRVYKAFDTVDGIEVAWNQVELCGGGGGGGGGGRLDAEQRERLFGEIRVLSQLRHRNVMSLFDWWYDPRQHTFNFITEYFTSGNLRQYRKKHRHISDAALGRWAWQVLEGLVYLHAHEPPIVHRDLKCDNLLVNGASGEVKIADLGLASCKRGLSVVGTPEFMAPEIYDEQYDEKVDVYSFGMCMLELATMEYPYAECRSLPAIYAKVSAGTPPASLSKVAAGPLRDMIAACIAHDPAARPAAMQLLHHDFFERLRASAAASGGGGGSSGSACSSPTHRAMGAGALAWGSGGGALQPRGARSSNSSSSLRSSGVGLPGSLAATAAAVASVAAPPPSGDVCTASKPSGRFAAANAGAGSISVCVGGASGTGSDVESDGGGGGSKAAGSRVAKTVCIPSQHLHDALHAGGSDDDEDEDSDDEVLVSLEDVLAAAEPRELLLLGSSVGERGDGALSPGGAAMQMLLDSGEEGSGSSGGGNAHSVERPEEHAPLVGGARAASVSAAAAPPLRPAGALRSLQRSSTSCASPAPPGGMPPPPPRHMLRLQSGAMLPMCALLEKLVLSRNATPLEVVPPLSGNGGGAGGSNAQELAAAAAQQQQQRRLRKVESEGVGGADGAGAAASPTSPRSGRNAGGGSISAGGLYGDLLIAAAAAQAAASTSAAADVSASSDAQRAAAQAQQGNNNGVLLLTPGPGGMGHIIVRRHFARQLHAGLTLSKRSQTL